MPERFCDELYVPSLQTAVLPVGAAAGAGHVSPDGGGEGVGDGVGGGVGAGGAGVTPTPITEIVFVPLV